MVETKNPRHYSSGNEDLDAKIAELVDSSGHPTDADLLREMITSCFRLARDRSDRGEMKLVNAALKEFAYSFKVFKPYRGIRKLSIFGSSRADRGAPGYEYARRFAEAIVQKGWMVITGAGPGIMEAGHEGAGAQLSFGANIRLPLETEPNTVISGDPKLINFKYFFTRKVTFLKESDAFVLFPGGFGTLDEAFELLTLMQTGKTNLAPVVLLESPETSYWMDWRRFIEEQLLARGLISEEDLNLVLLTDSIEAAVKEIEGFYQNYQSNRYVSGTLVLRLLRVPAAEDLDHMAHEFEDILRTPKMELVEPAPSEIADNDSLELPRIAIDFNQRSFGRLRQLIDRLNSY